MNSRFHFLHSYYVLSYVVLHCCSLGDFPAFTVCVRGGEQAKDPQLEAQA